MLNMSKNISTMQILMLLDGIINACVFFFYYLCFYVFDDKDFKTPDVTMMHKKTIIQKCKTLYTLSALDRYVLYFFVHFIGMLMDGLFFEYLSYMCVAIVVPLLQNKIVEMPLPKKYMHMYLERKTMFIRYCFSKIIIKYVQNMNKKIVQMNETHVFTLYNYVTFDFFCKAIKSYLFVHLMFFLKKYIYVYYKIIKATIYYKTGSEFSTINEEDAIMIVNKFISSNKWCEIDDLKLTCAFYNLISINMDMIEDTSGLMTNIMLFFSKLCSLWSMISFFKIINNYVLVSIMMCFVILFCTNNNNFADILSVMIAYCLILFDSNDLIITIIIIERLNIFLLLKQLTVFLKNIEEIEENIKNATDSILRQKVFISEGQCVLIDDYVQKQK